MSKIGLWSDNHNFPSIPLMKISAYHKSIGDEVEHFIPLYHYDKVYASKTFSYTSDIDDDIVVLADELEKGGTGYCIYNENGRELFDERRNTNLPKYIENIYPDYSLYPQYNFATGFLTRGCPRQCGFCHVGKKEGIKSVQVAEISDIWRGQKELELCDPNILACKEHEKLLHQLSMLKHGRYKVKVKINQGLDIRLVTEDNIKLMNEINMQTVYFAWDNPRTDLTKYFELYNKHTKIKLCRNKVVFILTNYDSTHEEDLYRVYTLRDLGYDPYITIYRKEAAPKITRDLARWCNSKIIFHSCVDFADYNTVVKKR